MGPLAASRQRDRVEGYIAKGVAEGATLAAGGGRPRHLERGWYVEPTVFGKVDNASTIAQEEIFGPVLSVIPADNEQHAIADTRRWPRAEAPVGWRVMDYRLLGRTGLRVSPLCLGTMNFGPLTDETTSHQIMDSALESGINFFDTANVYGRTETEQIVGRWYAQGGGRREKTVLATKVYGGRDPWPNSSRLSALHIRHACEASLRRLQTDHIDLYQMHHVDRDTPWQEIWQAMDLLVAQGKVLYVGSSNFAGWHIVQAAEAAKRRGSLGLVSEQSLYNLNARSVELEVLPACQAYGVGVLPWSPLGGGILGGALRKATDGRRGDARIQAQVELLRDKLEAWESLCAELGHDPADVALAWLLHQHAVTAPIVGPRTLDQLTGAYRALEISLEHDTLEALDKIFPGPGGAAPEAYAW